MRSGIFAGARQSERQKLLNKERVLLVHPDRIKYNELTGLFSKEGAILNMKYNLPDRILRELSSFAKKHSITQIILFGSRARGTNTERSDIDIAVYGGDFDGFYWDVKEKTHSLLMFDIVQADASVSDELKEEIEKDGVIIYEKA